eukprot:TRINITY_DN13320_c0_g1_i1.p1 TRINITY_DN13320_c0_g1~~TRINITY_DN13320_c0_g1_i1.p1  ORF type:complete len:727 (+),score=150.50 TRINITY_DN13320_c0_g1_i1:29-2209(+)
MATGEELVNSLRGLSRKVVHFLGTPETVDAFRLARIDGKRIVSNVESLTVSDRTFRDDPRNDGVLGCSNFVNQVLRDLNSIQTSVDDKISSLVKECHSEDSRNKRTLVSLEEQLKHIITGFSDLEHRVHNISLTAVRIGERLETFDRQRERALEAIELIDHFLEYVQGSEPAVFTDAGRLHEAAAQIHALQTFANGLSPEQVNDSLGAIDAIQKRASAIESTLLDKFSDAGRSQHYEIMRHCAQTLDLFKKDAPCQNRYANGRFLEWSPTVLNLEPRDTPRSEDEDALANEPAFKELLAAIKKECMAALDEVQKIFQVPDKVMGLYVERMFEEKIQNFVVTMLERDKQHSLLCYLRSLYASYTAVQGLAIELGDLPVDEYKITQKVQSIFNHFRDNYISYELACLQSLFKLKIEDFETILNDRGLEEAMMVFQIPLEMVHAAEEAARRAAALSKGEKGPEHVYQTFVMLIRFLGVDYVEFALDRGALCIPDGEFRPFLQVIQISTRVTMMVQRHLSKQLAKYISGDVNWWTSANTEKAMLVERLENKVCAGLEQILQAIMAHCEKLLEMQKKTDYRPNEGTEMTSDKPTPTCARVAEYIRQQHRTFTESLDGGNLDTMLTELAVRLYHKLMDHIRKFTISSDGGLRLMRDLTEFQKVVEQFKLPAVDAQYEVLRDIANVFVVSPQFISGLLTDSALRKLADGELATLVKMRADFKSEKLSKLFEKK